jgi:hypothetical protein
MYVNLHVKGKGKGLPQQAEAVQATGPYRRRRRRRRRRRKRMEPKVPKQENGVIPPLPNTPLWHVHTKILQHKVYF